MGSGISGVKKRVFQTAAVAGIIILLLFAAGCSGDLLGYITGMVAQAEEIKGIIDLPKTGQTDSYSLKDDGDLEMGVAWPVPRFTDNGNGTITDNLTGLMWDKTGNRFGTSTWSQALNECNALWLGGHSDWRLPNRKELRSLINYSKVNGAAWLNNPAQGFSNVQAGHYWSSTTYAEITDSACYIGLDVGDLVYGSKSAAAYVLAVRTGQAWGTVSLPNTGQTTTYIYGDDGDLEKGVAWPIPRFVDRGNGTICDMLTGFMWEQAPSGTSSWEDALSYANNLVLGGYSDWRLPNVNELESLINAEEMDPNIWLNAQGFSGIQGEFYWSSTTYAPTIDESWRVRMDIGDVSHNAKASTYYVLAVRAGD